MKVKTLTKIATFLLSLTFLFVGIVPVIQAGHAEPVVRSIELTESEIDNQSALNMFDSYTSELDAVEGKANFTGYKEIPLAELYDLDLIADADTNATAQTRFTCTFDYENGMVALSALLESETETVVLDEIYGVLFMNEEYEFDVAFAIEDEILLLSEMKEAGMVDECGFFSKIGSTLKKVWNTNAGKIGTIVTVAACAVVGGVCAVVPGGQLVTAVCIGVAVGAVGGAVTAAAATYEADGKVDWESVGICAGVGGLVGGAVSAISFGFVKLIDCFSAGTLVYTENGYVTIENINVGDKVWSTNPETGETALKEVIQLYKNETNEWIHVIVNGEEISCSPTHPFYSPVSGWINASELRAGDILVTLNGERIVVEQIQHELLENPEIKYNFQVADFHTYYVGESNVLVHNDCKLPSERKYQIAFAIGCSPLTILPTQFNYIEALSILAAFKLVGVFEEYGATLIPENLFTSNMLSVLKYLRNNNISKKYIGVYTFYQSDAASLAFALGGVGFGSVDAAHGTGGYYMHYHDIKHTIHVWFGTPV